MAINSIKNIPAEILQNVNVKKLRRADLNFPVPFQLELPHDEAVVCGELVRLVPKKRMVTFGMWQNKPVVIKLFFHRRHAKRHIHREIVGVETLLAAGTATPRILYQGPAKAKQIQVLIFERIVAAKSVDELWQKKNSENLIGLLKALTIEIAAQHVSGILQHDLHLKNFLVSNQKIYTLDGGSIEAIGEPLSKKVSLDNLALFFAQLGVGSEQLQSQLFECYVQARSWLITSGDKKYLQSAIKKYSANRWQQFDTKLMRSSTAFNHQKSFSTIYLYDRDYETPEFMQLLHNPERIFTLPNSQILKAGRSATVAKFTCDHKMLVIKRYNIKNIWHFLRRCLRKTRAAENWRLAHLLRLFGVPIVKPVACIEKKFFGLRSKSYLIMEYVEGEDSGEFFANQNAFRQEIADQLIALFNNLIKLRVTHGDLKKTNIIITRYGPVLLDLDGAKLHHSKRAAQRVFQRELKRFMRNWEAYPNIQALFVNASKIIKSP